MGWAQEYPWLKTAPRDENMTSFTVTIPTIDAATTYLWNWAALVLWFELLALNP